MRIYFYSPLLFIFFFTFFSCGKKKSPIARPFPVYYDFEADTSRLEKENPLIKKSVEMNGKTETSQDTVDWKNELALFINSDINKPQFKDSYLVDTLNTDSSVIIRFSANEDNLAVRLVEYRFRGKRLQEIFIRNEMSNIFTESYYELHYFPNVKYQITGRQSVPFFYDESFSVEGIFPADTKGMWRAALTVNKEGKTLEIPFLFRITNAGGNSSAEIYNAEEVIYCNEVSLTRDSLRIRMPVFDSELKAIFINDSLVNGAWYNYSKGPGYIVPFYAEKGKRHRFAVNSDSGKPGTKISGKWETDFNPGTKKHYKAVGIFNAHDQKVTGTFLTETGDYRFLDGNFTGDSLFLSCFDGSHAFLFMAAMDKDEKLSGTFWSGNHSQESFVARRNNKAALAHPDSLTFLKPGYDRISFSFPDLDSNLVSVTDPRYQNKVVIIQILGSWCPNCLDETVFLTGLYNKYHKDSLEIIGLAFERSSDFVVAKKAVERFKQQLNAPYPILIAGTASTAKANEALPMLNKVMSFPTTIFINRGGEVRKIHTGFYGPGTGEYYWKFHSETTTFIEKLLGE